MDAVDAPDAVDAAYAANELRVHRCGAWLRGVQGCQYNPGTMRDGTAFVYSVHSSLYLAAHLASSRQSRCSSSTMR
jgi:hypothetical protein